MSKQSNVESALKTELTKAVAKDEKVGNSDIAKGIFGVHTLKYIEEFATVLCKMTLKL